MRIAVWTAVDYYQAMFEAEQEADDPGSPYLLIQRQFENPDDDLCYVATHDENYIGHFVLRRVEFTLRGLSIEFDRPNDNLLSVPSQWHLQISTRRRGS